MSMSYWYDYMWSKQSCQLQDHLVGNAWRIVDEILVDQPKSRKLQREFRFRRSHGETSIGQVNMSEEFNGNFMGIPLIDKIDCGRRSGVVGGVGVWSAVHVAVHSSSIRIKSL